MKIKRGFSWLGAARKYKVLVNDEEVSTLKLNKEIEVEQPEGEFTLQFRTMKLERSKKYYIKTRDEVYVKANLNPAIKVIFLVDFLVMILLVAFRRHYTYEVFLIGIIASLVIFYFVYYKIFVKNYITFKVYDRDNSLIPIEEVK